MPDDPVVGILEPVDEADDDDDADDDDEPVEAALVKSVFTELETVLTKMF